MAEQLAITVPYGVVPGQQMKATTPDGRCFMLTVPRERPRARAALARAIPLSRANLA